MQGRVGWVTEGRQPNGGWSGAQFGSLGRRSGQRALPLVCFTRHSRQLQRLAMQRQRCTASLAAVSRGSRRRGGAAARPAPIGGAIAQARCCPHPWPCRLPGRRAQPARRSCPPALCRRPPGRWTRPRAWWPPWLLRRPPRRRGGAGGSSGRAVECAGVPVARAPPAIGCKPLVIDRNRRAGRWGGGRCLAALAVLMQACPGLDSAIGGRQPAMQGLLKAVEGPRRGQGPVPAPGTAQVDRRRVPSPQGGAQARGGSSRKDSMPTG